MSVSDPVADMLTIIRNASLAEFEKADIRTSKLKLEIIKILKNEGYIKNFKKVMVNDKPVIRVFLKYDDKQKSVINGIKSVSTPGRRVYSGYKEIRITSYNVCYTKLLRDALMKLELPAGVDVDIKQ